MHINVLSLVDTNKDVHKESEIKYVHKITGLIDDMLVRDNYDLVVD